MAQQDRQQTRLLGKIQGYLEAVVDFGPEAEETRRLAERLLEMIVAADNENGDRFDEELLDELEYYENRFHDDDEDDFSDAPF